MLPVFGAAANAAQPLPPAERVNGAPAVRPPEGEPRGRSLKPATDEYVHAEKREPTGRYWPGKDESGRPRIYFDDPEKPDEAPEAGNPARDRGAEGPKRTAPDRKTERCVGNTDKVDREIEQLKRRQQALQQQLNTETDEARARELERELAQVESELRQKDNDAYRRQHTVFS